MIDRLLDPTLVQALGRLVPGARRTALGPSGGLHRSPFKGASVDFRQHRMYVPGDDPRRLDWRVLARTDRPFVREYDDETTRRTLLVVDASGSMAYGRPARKADDAARLAAALLYVTLAGGESAGVALAKADGDAWVAPQSSATQLGRVLDALARTEPAGPTALDVTLERAAGRIGRRALVLIVSDLLLPAERLRRALARLRHGRHDVSVIRVLHPDEQEFPFRGWVRFRALETRAAVLRQATLSRPQYLAQFRAHAEAIQAVCRATRTDRIDHAVGRPLIDTVRDVIRRRRR